MAFRIHDNVIRGEIDNRVKGIVRGKIWLKGRAEPILLELKGNAWPDLAGCLLTFTNPQTSTPSASIESLAPLQRGSIGDLTASRKVRVFDVPLEEALEMIDRQEKPPEHMANSLYLEWFSEANGRVVIESADFELAISTPEWRLTPQEERDRSRQADAGLRSFVDECDAAIEQDYLEGKPPLDEWDEHDYEKFLKECDARTENCDTDEEDDSEPMSVDEINALCQKFPEEPLPDPDPQREGIDWIRTEDGDIRHPLQNRCFESSLNFSRQAKQLGLDKLYDEDLQQFLFEFRTTAVKLGGALNTIVRGPGFCGPAFTVAYLKRALDHLHKAQAGLCAVAPKNLLPRAMIVEAQAELFSIREGILKVMDEFRGRS